MLAYNFAQASGAITNYGIGGPDGDLTIVDAAVARSVPVPGGNSAIAYHGLDARRVWSAGGQDQADNVDDLIISADQFTMSAFYFLTEAPFSNSYTRIFWKYAGAPAGDSFGIAYNVGNTQIYGYIRTNPSPAAFAVLTADLVNSPWNVSWARGIPGPHMMTFSATAADNGGNRDLTLYLDGKLAISASQNIPAPLQLYDTSATAGSWCVGSEDVGSGNTIAGVMCHARVDRVVRDAAWVEAAWRNWRGWA